MKTKTKKALSEFAVYLIMIMVHVALIGICNDWFCLNGWPIKVFFPLLIISAVYVNYKLWRRLCRRLDSKTDQAPKKKERY